MRKNRILPTSSFTCRLYKKLTFWSFLSNSRVCFKNYWNFKNYQAVVPIWMHFACSNRNIAVKIQIFERVENFADLSSACDTCVWRVNGLLRLKSILPCGRFLKSVPQGIVNIQIHTLYVWFLDLVISERENIVFRSAKWSYLLEIHTGEGVLNSNGITQWNQHSLLYADTKYR